MHGLIFHISQYNFWINVFYENQLQRRILRLKWNLTLRAKRKWKVSSTSNMSHSLQKRRKTLILKRCPLTWLHVEGMSQLLISIIYFLFKVWIIYVYSPIIIVGSVSKTDKAIKDCVIKAFASLYMVSKSLDFIFIHKMSLESAMKR